MRERHPHRQSPWELEPGLHGHICENQACGWAWTHTEASMNVRDDHTCPQCGTLLGPGWMKAYPEQVRERLKAQAVQ